MKNLKNKYFINGKNFSRELKEPYLKDLIEIFLKSKLFSWHSIVWYLNLKKTSLHELRKIVRINNKNPTL